MNYQLIYFKIRNPKDAVVFASLSKSTHEIMVTAKQRWHLGISRIMRDAGVDAWIDAYPDKVRGLTYASCCFSPNLRVSTAAVESLAFDCCRVFADTLDVPFRQLKSLRVHQLMPTHDPGTMTTILNGFEVLEHLSLQFHCDWGLASIGPLVMPRLTILSLRNTGGCIQYNQGNSPLKDVSFFAEDLIIDGKFDETIEILELHATESFVDVEYIPSSVRRLGVSTKGVIIMPFFAALESVVARCDAFIFGSISDSLKSMCVDVKLCFVMDTMSDDDVSRYGKLESFVTTENGRVVHLKLP